jgi:hypothetical protein
MLLLYRREPPIQLGQLRLCLDLSDHRVERRTCDLVLPTRAIAIDSRIGI